MCGLDYIEFSLFDIDLINLEERKLKIFKKNSKPDTPQWDFSRVVTYFFEKYIFLSKIEYLTTPSEDSYGPWLNFQKKKKKLVNFGYQESYS